MAKSKNTIFDSIVPFIILGISIAVFVALIVLLSYVFIWGLVIGGILWLVAFVKEQLFPRNKKRNQVDDNNESKSKGRIIEYDEIDK